MHRIVIIGSGFGGLFAAQALKNEDVEITLIDKTSHHLFQPLLYQVATGILSEGEIAPSTREILADQKNVRVLLGLVENIDIDNKVIHWRNHDRHEETEYDTLILAAGCGQSYFGNDHFAKFAPGMKTIDDALEVRARIFGAFELAELETDPAVKRELLTFVVVGAGPTGVEVAGQIRELASETLQGEFRNIDPSNARVILLDGAKTPLPTFGEKLGGRARRALGRLGVEVRTETLVTNVTANDVTLRDRNGNEETIPCFCKVWAAGVQGSPLGRQVAEQAGVELDRAGRVTVNPDLSVPSYPDVFVIGDLMSAKGAGVAQGAIQSGRFVSELLKRRLGKANRQMISYAEACASTTGTYKYFDRGSMATIARFKAVVSIGKIKLGGFPAWLAWCFLHLLYIVGFKAQVNILVHWAISFLSSKRTERTVTNQQMVGRLALEALGSGSSAKLMAGKEKEEL